MKIKILTWFFVGYSIVIGACLVISLGGLYIISPVTYRLITVGTVGETTSKYAYIKEIGVRSFEEAYRDQNRSEMTRLDRLYETVDLTGTPVIVTSVHGGYIQIEAMSGQHIGKRGWISMWSFV